MKKRPSPFGGAGGLSGERPPLDATDAELDRYAEALYAGRMAQFELYVATARKTLSRRSFRDYTHKNCEESWGARRKA